MEFIEQAQHFRQTGQLRLMICDLDDQPLGLLDFFHANFKHHFTSIGILIANDKRQLGYATDALQLGVNYARKVFDFNNIFASIHESNEASLNLFKKTGFEQIGLRKNCFKFDGKYSNEVLLQLEIE
jgi:diamine N-acetyltransferase